MNYKCLLLMVCLASALPAPAQEVTSTYLEDRFAFQEAGRHIQSAVLLSMLGSVVATTGLLWMNEGGMREPVVLGGIGLQIAGPIQLWHAGRIMEIGMPLVKTRDGLQTKPSNRPRPQEFEVIEKSDDPILPSRRPSRVREEVLEP